MDVNGDGTVVNCSPGGISGCADNEMGFLFWEEGITAAAPSPFSNVAVDAIGQAKFYWSGTEVAPSDAFAWVFEFDGVQGVLDKSISSFTWAVRDGDVFIPIGIDIKPGSFPNSINLCSNGAVPIAILGSDTFDVNDVNTETLRFAEASVRVVGKKDPHSLCSYEDVNGDFITDLVCHFVTTDIAGIHGDSTSATVNGELLDGTPIQGTDSVNIVKDTCN